MPIPSGSSDPVELADVKAHLNLTGDGDDAELQQMLDAAVAHLSRLVGPLTATAYTERLSGNSGGPLILSHTPVVSLTSVAYSDGTSVDVDDLDVGENGLVYWNYGTTGYWTTGSRNVTVVYEAGRSDLPADLRLAVLELTRHLWTTQRGIAENRPRFDDGPDDFAPTGSSFTLPRRVEELIAPFRYGSVIA